MLSDALRALICSQMHSFDFRCYQMLSIHSAPTANLKRIERIADNLRCSAILSNVFKSFQMLSDALRFSPLLSNALRLSQLLSDALRCF
jgi:hypothetical protein